MERTKIRKTYRLSGPARFVVDVNTNFPKKRVPVYFVDDDKVVAGEDIERSCPKCRSNSIRHLKKGKTAGAKG